MFVYVSKRTFPLVLIIHGIKIVQRLYRTFFSAGKLVSYQPTPSPHPSKMISNIQSSSLLSFLCKTKREFLDEIYDTKEVRDDSTRKRGKTRFACFLRHLLRFMTEEKTVYVSSYTFAYSQHGTKITQRSSRMFSFRRATLNTQHNDSILGRCSSSMTWE